MSSIFRLPQIVWLLGFISGFTLLISGSILNFWFAQEQVDKSTIGYFALVSLPYAISFLWAPFLDTLRVPLFTKYLGHRLGWVIAIKIMLVLALYTLSKLSPRADLPAIAIVATIITALSATKDVILGALRTELLTVQAQASTSGLYILTYRLGMLIASSGTILLSSYITWATIFQLLALCILLLGIVLIILRHQLMPSQQFTEQLEHKSIALALVHLGSIKFLSLLLVFLLLYRLPDHFIIAMINPFLLELGYNEVAIAGFGKVLGLSVAAAGGLFASYLMNKITITKALWFFGIMHGISHLGFIMLKTNQWPLFAIINTIAAFTNGMAMTAYIALISMLCQGQYRATKYAILTATMGVSRAIFPSLSGIIVIKYGWDIFFIIMSIASVPAIVFLHFLRPYLYAFENKE